MYRVRGASPVAATDIYPSFSATIGSILEAMLIIRLPQRTYVLSHGTAINAIPTAVAIIAPSSIGRAERNDNPQIRS